jgi:imidazolonepropionase-like amidohydrolase
MDTVIKAKTLINGSGAPALSDPAILVRDATIAGVFQGAIPDGLAAPDAHVLELPDCTLLPGLIDCHVHLNLPGDGTSFVDSVREPDGVLVATAAHNVRTALEAGITTLRDTGGRGSTTFALRRTLQLGYGSGSRLVLCGQPITITGGHTWYFGGEADGVDGVRHKAREMVKLGADFIKVMGSGGGTPGTMSWLPAFRREEIQAVTDEAHYLGRKISIHCLCAESIQFAADAGVDQIEHAGFIIDAAGTQRFVPAAADAIARSGALVTATLAVGGYVVSTVSAKTQRTPAEQHDLDRWHIMLEDNLRQFAGLLTAGVQFVAGTDAGWRVTPFDALPDEMQLMHEGGLSSSEAIVAATSRAARSLGIESEVGTVKEGFKADIIAVTGNPLDDLLVLKNPHMVMQAGNLVVGREHASRTI